LNAWEKPPVFEWLRSGANIQTDEMLRTFNCGIGMAIVVAEDKAKVARNILEDKGESVFPIGVINAMPGDRSVTFEGAW
jgi:phosphoribosylformylglycinamidine cyclo-ligase